VNEVRIRELTTSNLVFCNATTSIHDAAESMTAGRFRHLPVVDDTGLIGWSTSEIYPARCSAHRPNDPWTLQWPTNLELDIGRILVARETGRRNRAAKASTVHSGQ
jgi:CBS domain-containing protein